MRNFGFLSLAACLLMTGCGGLSLPAPPAGTQSAAQKLNAFWPQIQSAVALGLLADNASPAVVAAVTADETKLGAAISQCASGTDPTCAATEQAAITSFIAGLKLSPKAQLELQALQGIFPG